MLTSLFALGVPLFAYSVGRFALAGRLQGDLRHSALARAVLFFAFGVAVLTPILVVVAALGAFHVAVLGSISWVATTVFYFSTRSTANETIEFANTERLAVVAAIVFFGVALSGRDETLGSGRDQQIYAEFAIRLADRGTFASLYPNLDDADKVLLSTGYKAAACTAPALRTAHSERREPAFVVPGGVNACNGVDQPIGLLHPSGWPVWLAIADAAFGVEGVYRANAAIFAAAGLVFFLVVRHVTSGMTAFAALALLFMLPSSLWIAGISLSEPLAMMLVLALPLLMTSRTHAPVIVGIAVVAVCLVRIDALIVVPALMLASLRDSWTREGSTSGVEARRLIVSLAGAMAVVMALVAWLFPRYFDATIDATALAAGASIVLGALAFCIPQSFAQRFGEFLVRPYPRLLTILALVSLFVYAAWLRPNFPPFSILRDPPSLAGLRDFREESVRHFATYVTWPTTLAAVAGVCFAIWNRWATSQSMTKAALLTLALASASLYFWFPAVAPDHPWGFRRFIPVVVPFAVLFAGVFVHALTQGSGRRGAAFAVALLMAPGIFLVRDYGPRYALLRENDGLTRQIADLASQLPDQLVVADSSVQDIGSALFVAYGKSVAVAFGGLHPSGDPSSITAWIRTKTGEGKSAWLLHGPQLWQSGLLIAERKDWPISRTLLVPTMHPPATDITTEQSRIYLTRIDGLDPTFATRMFGGERVWGAQESGFYGSEVAAFGMFRYTNGDAWIDVPAAALRDATALKLDLFSYAKPGAKRWLRVLVGDSFRWEGIVGDGPATVRVPLSSASELTGPTTRIRIQSQHADAVDLGAGNPRPDLSIGIIGIRPLFDGQSSLATWPPGIFRARLSGDTAQPGRLETSVSQTAAYLLDVVNAGTAYWPGTVESADPSQAVTLAVRWYSRDHPTNLIGENRIALAFSLLPGDRTRIRVPLAPVFADLRRLPPGQYTVELGLLRESVEMSIDNGEQASIPVTVVQ